MALEIHPTEGLPPVQGPYSQVVSATGTRQVFVSGQVPEDGEGNLVGAGDMEAQARQVFRNLAVAMERAGGTLADVAKIGIFLTEATPEAFAVLGRIRRELFGARPPASTLVEVRRLASPDWLLEVEAYAVLDR